MNFLKTIFNKPKQQNECFCGRSVFVQHDEALNTALANEPKDMHLHGNGLTIDDLANNKAFIETGDLLDKAAIAAKESGSLSAENRKTIKALKEMSKKTSKKL